MHPPSGRVGQPLNFRVAAPSRFFEGAEGLVFRSDRGPSGDGINADQSVFDVRIEEKTAPRPVLGMIDQFPFQRVHVHVVEFFHSLFQTPYIEIVETPLPETWQRIVATCKDQIQLFGGPPLFYGASAAKHVVSELELPEREFPERVR